MVADNILFPGAPEYKKWMEDHPDFVTTWHEDLLEYTRNITDMVGVSEYRPRQDATETAEV